MFNGYEDITDRIGEPPKWWDEVGVPRYADFSPYLIWNIYAHETALVEIACSACWSRFQVAFSNRSVWPEVLGNCKTIAEAIEKGKLHYGDPPNYGNCEAGASMTCYDLRVLQYWLRSIPMRSWTRDSRLEIELPDNRELERPGAERMICGFRDLRKF